MTGADYIRNAGLPWPTDVQIKEVREKEEYDSIEQWREKHRSWLSVCEGCECLVERTKMGGKCTELAKDPRYSGCGCGGRVTIFTQRTDVVCPLGKHSGLTQTLAA